MTTASGPPENSCSLGRIFFVVCYFFFSGCMISEMRRVCQIVSTTCSILAFLVILNHLLTNIGRKFSTLSAAIVFVFAFAKLIANTCSSFLEVPCATQAYFDVPLIFSARGSFYYFLQQRAVYIYSKLDEKSLILHR